MAEIYTRREAMARVARITSGFAIAATIGCNQEIDVKPTRPELYPSPNPTVLPTIEAPNIEIANPPEVIFENKAKSVEEKVVMTEPVKNFDPKSPTPAPEKPLQPLKITLVPKKITIPSSGINYDQIQQSIEIHDISAPGKTTFYVPDQGVATPYYDLTNKIIVFGHSRIRGIQLPMAKLEDVNPESIILVDCVQPETQKQFINMVFVVSAINLGDKDSVAPILFGETPEIPTLYIQTSIRESTIETEIAKPWILNEEKIRTKAHSIVEGNENDPKKYLLLLVVAHPTKETLARLRSSQ